MPAPRCKSSPRRPENCWRAGRVPVQDKIPFDRGATYSGVEEAVVVRVDRGEEEDGRNEYESFLAQAAAAGGFFLITRGASVRQLIPPELVPLQGARRRPQVVLTRLPLRPPC